MSLILVTEMPENRNYSRGNRDSFLWGLIPFFLDDEESRFAIYDSSRRPWQFHPWPWGNASSKFTKCSHPCDIMTRPCLAEPHSVWGSPSLCRLLTAFMGLCLAAAKCCSRLRCHRSGSRPKDGRFQGKAAPFLVNKDHVGTLRLGAPFTTLVLLILKPGRCYGGRFPVAGLLSVVWRAIQGHGYLNCQEWQGPNWISVRGTRFAGSLCLPNSFKRTDLFSVEPLRKRASWV